MSDVSTKPVIFISYSQTDRFWLDYVRSFFAPLKQYDLHLWDDTQLLIGSDWRDDIFSALDACHVFIVLVSRYSLASNFVMNVEIPRILQRPKEEVRLCPILVTPYPIPELGWLDDTSRRPREGKALSELDDPVRDREMATITEQIDGILRRTLPVGESKPKPQPAPQKADEKSRPGFPSIVDCGRLPEAPFKKLVGRDAELKRLDDAWNDDRTWIVSLVAWGGAGKTSIAIEWIARLRDDGYRGADAVLCWSFYSQGTSNQRAASGDGFINWALAKLKIEVDTSNAAAKGERLAEELLRRRILLVLDGLEPLQYGAEGQEGGLKDIGLAAFFRDLAVNQPVSNHSLVVLTSRLVVRDLAVWNSTVAPVVDVLQLSDEAGAAILRSRGVSGSDDDRRRASREFGGHGLALTLLAGYLGRLHGGDVNQIKRIRAVNNLDDGRNHDQAKRVIEAFDKEWIAREPILTAIMCLLGLFDRPATAGCIRALRERPIMKGLSKEIVGLDDEQWHSAVDSLRAARLLDPEDASDPDSIDAHPLIREWFGERFRKSNVKAWQAAHRRLYRHLRDAYPENRRPTFADLGLLNQAIAHGCRAGLYEDALEEIYAKRMCLEKKNGDYEYYLYRGLGAIGTGLASIAWFFEAPFVKPVSGLSKENQSWIFGEAGAYLRAQGRLRDALDCDRASLLFDEKARDYDNASISANNLAELLLLSGKIDDAVVIAKKAVEYADKGGRDPGKLDVRLLRAHCVFAAQGIAAARIEFLACKEKASRKVITRTAGYYFRDFLLAEHQFSEAFEASRVSLPKSERGKDLFEIGLDALTLARASTGLALSLSSGPNVAKATEYRQIASEKFDYAVEKLLDSGRREDLARSTLARSCYRRLIGDWQRVQRDLDEIEELAEFGPMKLFLCDVALERARLIFAKIEMFAPLNRLVRDNRPELTQTNAAQVDGLKGEAIKQLAIAADYITTCGYHRRDDELTELQAVLRGARKFADLHPRV